MDRDLAERAVEVAVKADAEYAEARLQRSVDQVAVLKNGEVEAPGYGETLGLGIRVMYKGSLAFGATNALERSSVTELATRLTKQAKASAPYFKEKIRLSREDVHLAKWRAEEKESLDDLTLEGVISYLKDLDSVAMAAGTDVKLVSRVLYLATEIEEKYFVNSDGSKIDSRVPRLMVYAILTGASGGNLVQRTAQYGEAGGWEALKRIGVREKVGEEATMVLKILRDAAKFVPGQMDVLVGHEVAGIMAHESVGHPSEADRILGREAAQAGESYLTADDVGLRVGSVEANVSDDPTLPHAYGHYLYDEEGVTARKRRLMAGGVVTELLQNRETAQTFGVDSNASARAVRYDREPIVRMANTYVEPGDYTFEELLKEIPHGVFIKNFMEWNIDDKRLNGRYVGHEAYMIEHGEVKGLVRNPIIEISTPKLWSSVHARGRDMEFGAATCGKGDPSQGAPVWHGGPNFVVKDIKVGAR
ncbi:MAG TPA: TldD/PmbA family protein [Conexivisphaerales archaeon]|nr:TldD/PmbA family protein [Conexivisphaerales archaeon]